MGESAAPLTAYGIVLADKHRTGSQRRELVLDAESETVVESLLESDLHEFHTRYTSHVSVAVLAPAGHLNVGVYPHDGNRDWPAEEFFDTAETDGAGCRVPTEKAGLIVESTCTAERADAVLRRLVETIESDRLNHRT